MQIQRIQTLMMVLAVAAMIVFLFVPFGGYDIELITGADANPPLVASQQPVMLGLSVLVCVLILCAVFLYNRMPLQKSLVAISAVLVLALACGVIYLLTRPVKSMALAVDSVTPVWGGGGLLLVAAFVALVAAYRGISNDQKLLRSYNSLR